MSPVFAVTDNTAISEVVQACLLMCTSISHGYIPSNGIVGLCYMRYEIFNSYRHIALYHGYACLHAPQPGKRRSISTSSPQLRPSRFLISAHPVQEKSTVVLMHISFIVSEDESLVK